MRGTPQTTCTTVTPSAPVTGRRSAQTDATTITGSDLAGDAATDEQRAILARNVARIEAETEAKRAATCPACGSTDPANLKPWHYFSEDACAEIGGITCRACGAHFEVGPDGSHQIAQLPAQVQAAAAVEHSPLGNALNHVPALLTDAITSSTRVGVVAGVTEACRVLLTARDAARAFIRRTLLQYR